MAARRRLTLKRLDPWSVLKFGFLANLCLLLIGLLGAVVVWFFVNRLGLIEQACGVAESVGFENCGINGGNLFRALLLLGLLGVIIQTGVLVFLSFLHNLIADLVGGIQVSVVDESARAVGETAQSLRSERSGPQPVGATARSDTSSHPRIPGTKDTGGGGSTTQQSTPSVPEANRAWTGREQPSSGGETMFGGRSKSTGPIRQAGESDSGRDRS